MHTASADRGIPKHVRSGVSNESVSLELVIVPIAVNECFGLVKE